MTTKHEQLPLTDVHAFIEHIRTLHLPRYDELPPVYLYMDQVLIYVEDQLQPLVSANEKLLTSSMVNNYVKQRVLPTPKRKRYGREHIARLIAICLLKRTFAIDDIHRLFKAQAATHATDRSYNFFCTAVEESLRALFCGAPHPSKLGTTLELNPVQGFAFSLNVKSTSNLTPERRMAISAVTCATNKIYVEKCFELHILDFALEKTTPDEHEQAEQAASAASKHSSAQAPENLSK